ncbi:hypothetical protein EGT74_11550 [Chitinophaga lutea]|uniref:Beta-carotene 15,15'-monooxygenase n=1 Tax=Chitinophaga lutea TaxID=2488634 RepID=A0A3N4QDS4_9BACT|nr:hypothetical protein EGT74_11550 [Chitinophaga lutea]
MLLFIYTLFVKFYYLINPSVYQADGSEGLVYDALTAWLEGIVGKSPLFFTAATVMLQFLQALLLTRIINNHRLFPKDTYLPAMSYLLFTSLLESWNVFSPAVLVNTIMLWIFSGITDLYMRSSARDVAFNLGFAMGICGLFYFPALLFVALLFVSLLIMRSFRLAEWIIGLLGLICPFYLLGTWLFLTNRWDAIENLPRIGFHLPMITNYKVWGAFVVSLLFFVTGWLMLQRTFNKMLIQGRKIWSAMAVYVLVAIFIPFFSATFTPGYWVLAILPLSLFAGNVFWTITNNTFANAVHLLVLAYVIIMQYFSH